MNSWKGFIIDEKISINSLSQYKVHNSKRKTFYITIYEIYMHVKYEKDKKGSFFP